jgi:hypothetical protein
MFTDNGNNSYGVRFYVKGVAQYVTVNNALPGGGAVFNHGSTLWASLAEKAYAQFQSVNAWGSIGNGGNPINALAALTGSKAYKEYWGSSTGWSGYTLNSALSITGSFSNLAGSTMLTELIAHLNARDDVILCSYTNAYDSYGKKTLISSHAMSIYGYNATTGMLQVRNPWGSATNQSWATTFEVSLSTLQAARDWIMVDNAGAGLPTTPVLLSQTPTQNFVKGLSYAFSVAGAFADPDGAALTYTATQTGGSALPGWLAFNASTGQFTAAPLASASGVSVIVTAKDSDGYASSETFAINVASALAPKLKAQTANKTAVGGKAVSIALASNTFVDPQGETMSYSATQASGAALPNWLSFDAAKRLFSGTTPTSGGTYALKVTATNTGGASASETFNLKVSASAAKVASLIAGDAGGFFSPAPQAAGAYAVLDLLAPAA